MTSKVGMMPIPEKALGESMEKGGKKMKGGTSVDNSRRRDKMSEKTLAI